MEEPRENLNTLTTVIVFRESNIKQDRKFGKLNSGDDGHNYQLCTSLPDKMGRVKEHAVFA